MADWDGVWRRPELRALTDYAADFIALFDLDQRYIFVNRALATAWNRRAADFTGHDVAGMGAPAEHAALWKEHFAAVAAAGVPRTFDYTLHLDGAGERVLETLLAPVHDGAGRVHAYSAITRDITEQRRAAAGLAAANRRVQLLLESTDEGILGLDDNGVCTFVNPAAMLMLDYSEEQMLGHEFYGLVRHTRGDGTPIAWEESPIYRCIYEQQRFRASGELFWRDELRRIPVEYSVSPVEADEGSGAVLIFHDVSEKHTLTRELHHQALHDPLTGLVNRRGFELKLADLLEDARSVNREHALCYIDLDHFKLVNDNCGHAAGDELLRQLPKMLQPLVRREDTFARLGGDEFGVLLLNCPLSEATQIAETLREAVAAFRFAWQHRTFTVGASIGVAAITAASQSAVAVMGAADSACYVAKEKGKNNVHVSYPNDLAVIRRRGEMRWVTRLKTALEENQFRLYCQSIASIRAPAAAPLHHELLLRLIDAKGELILPSAFLPAAERYQLMPAIDAWVIRAALKMLGPALAARPELRAHRFGINLSGDSLRDNRLLDVVARALEEFRVPAQMLYFEITETAAIANLGVAVEFMRELKKLGCLLALDDFGSGMSSFSYLKHLPVDYLKIDGSFIKDLLRNPIDQAIVRAINTVGQHMGVKTIAEYVENDAVLSLLREMGIDFAQGHGRMEPQPLAEFLARSA